MEIFFLWLVAQKIDIIKNIALYLRKNGEYRHIAQFGQRRVFIIYSCPRFPAICPPRRIATKASDPLVNMAR